MLMLTFQWYWLNVTASMLMYHYNCRYYWTITEYCYVNYLNISPIILIYSISLQTLIILQRNNFNILHEPDTLSIDTVFLYGTLQSWYNPFAVTHHVTKPATVTHETIWTRGISNIYGNLHVSWTLSKQNYPKLLKIFQRRFISRLHFFTRFYKISKCKKCAWYIKI